MVTKNVQSELIIQKATHISCIIVANLIDVITLDFWYPSDADFQDGLCFNDAREDGK